MRCDERDVVCHEYMFLSQLPANRISGPVRGGESARHVTGAVAPRYGKDIWLNYEKTGLVSVPSI